ncbi:MAG: methyltransferase domain-containing protein [Candidatus Eisenbacteria bacterium]
MTFLDPRADDYAELAAVYDDWQYLYPQPFALSLRPRLVAVLDEFSTPCETYADLGCGTGLLAAWWKQRYADWRVYGVDRSPAMIEQARQTATRGAQKQALMQWGLTTRGLHGASFDDMMAAAEQMQAGRPGSAPENTPRDAPLPAAQDGDTNPMPSKSGVDFRVQGLDDIDLPEPIGMATCVFDGINHILRVPDLVAAFRSVRSALADGGLFVFDLVHEDVFADAFDGAVIRKGPGLVVTADSIGFTRGNHLFGKTTFAVFREENGVWRRYDAEISERCWRRSEIVEALESAGLSLLRQDDIDPAKETEFQLPRTFWICRRPLGGSNR